MAECKPILLLDIWRTCNKIRAAIFRSGLDLWSHYLPLDPEGYSLVSEAKFVSVLAGPLKDVIGLSEQEVLELADYFKAPDGRVLYRQFCQVIHDNIPDFKQYAPLVCGLEWEDPYHVNSLSMAEERRIMLLLTKIATLVKARNLVLLPHFQDYEIIAKNHGTITISHFARILHFLKIFVAPDEFRLLVRKFLKDGYTVNYMAFVSALQYVYQYMERCGITDLGGEVLPNFQGRALTAELPKLPRPEVGTVPTDAVFGVQKIFHPVLNKPRNPESLSTIISRIQRYVYTEGVRIGQFFGDFDHTNCGRLPESAFRRCVDMMGVGEAGTRRYNLTSEEMNDLVDAYRDPLDPTRVMWRVFEDDIEAVFTKKGLERLPDYHVDCPPMEVRDLPRRGNVYSGLSEDRMVSCEDVVRIVKDKIRRNGLNLLPDFNDFDRARNGHVNRNQFRQVLKLNCILLSDEQVYSLEQRYLDELGLNYFQFMKEVDPYPEPQPLYEQMIADRVKLNTREFTMPVKAQERDIVAILAKIKKQLICYRVKLSQFMSQYDLHNQLVISRQNFDRSLDEKLCLTPTEKQIIMQVFASPTRPECVEYQRFCNTVEEAFSQPLLERAPLLEPLQHVACHDGKHNFLNFEERQLVSLALENIAAKPTDALLDIFKSIDRHNCGTVNQSEFLRALTVLCLHTLVSAIQFEALVKCFAKPRGLRDEVDYRNFVDAISIVKQNWKAKNI
ncbi:uncharacterized protein LOC128986314 [Macrosteles quadrilineatus]|uniref:uncharacterized protein LOC128986314 n=1 Tax=Macrosteles quadrilineatus TaxID=74068 RepID=UPI0023E2C03B|nr:uncharacterized protein LOC128986314 [Macrosteles quadrilineatus]